jgi:YVTN family beta-propeller protein
MTTRSANKPGGMILTSVLWMTRLFFVASALCGAHAEQHNPANATTFGYLTNANDNTISVIATNNNTVVATIPVGDFPTGVATTPDGTHAYVRNFGNTVSVIATANNTVVATIPVGNGGLIIGTGIAITPDGAHAYVANEFDNTVSVIATASNTVVATIPVGNGPSGIAITPDGTHAYVANELDQSAQGFAIVSVIDTASNTVVATIPVGDNPVRVAITPDGTRSPERDDRRHQALAYVTNAGDNTVSVIATASNTVVATIPVGNGPSGVAITQDGTHAYVTNSVDNTVSVIDNTTHKVVATIPVGAGPVDVAITSDGTDPSEQDGRPHQPHAYVTDSVDNTVSVIDIARNKVVATIPVGTFPFSVAFATVTPPHGTREQ